MIKKYYKVFDEYCKKSWPDPSQDTREWFERDDHFEKIEVNNHPEIDEFMGNLTPEQKNDLFCFGDESTSHLCTEDFKVWHKQQEVDHSKSWVQKLITRRNALHQDWLGRILTRREYMSWQDRQAERDHKRGHKRRSHKFNYQ